MGAGKPAAQNPDKKGGDKEYTQLWWKVRSYDSRGHDEEDYYVQERRGQDKKE